MTEGVSDRSSSLAEEIYKQAVEFYDIAFGQGRKKDNDDWLYVLAANAVVDVLANHRGVRPLTVQADIDKKWDELPEIDNLTDLAAVVEEGLLEVPDFEIKLKEQLRENLGRIVIHEQ